MKALPSLYTSRLGPLNRRRYDQRPADAVLRDPCLTGWDRGEARTPSPDARSLALARLEAALFLADEPLTLRRLAEVAGLKEGTEARRLLAQLQDHLQSASSSFQIEEIAGGFQLLTGAVYQLWLARLRRPGHIARLTPALLETLTVVAYRQPLTRADVEAIRGVDCGEMLRLLMEYGLVRALGRQATLGRPQLYGTAKMFLQAMGLKSLEGLRPLEE